MKRPSKSSFLQSFEFSEGLFCFKIKGPWIPLFLNIFLFLSCGYHPRSGVGSSLQFGIKSPYTTSKTNEIFVKGAKNLKIKIENLGESFTSSVPLQELVPAPEQISLSYHKKTKYSAMVSIYSDDGELLAKDKIQWTHDDIVPPKPIVGFSERATNDPNIILLFASNRGPLTKKAWISGDLGGEFPKDGSLYDIPKDGRLPLSVSENPGLKVLTIKLHNEFGLESEPVTINILHKTSQPNACDALVAATLIAQNRVRIKLLGNDTEKLFFGVQGDTGEFTNFKTFISGQIHEIPLLPGYGEKKITVLIRDEAENYCLKKDFLLTVNKDAVESWLTIDSDPAFTTQKQLSLELKVNEFPDSPLEMLLLGHIEESEKNWRPYEPKILTTLSDGVGEKVIEAFVRPIGAQKIRYRATTRVLYSPTAYRKYTPKGILLVFSEFSRIAGIGIKGCQEGGSHLKPQATLLCSPNGEELSVTYFFDNNTSTEIKL